MKVLQVVSSPRFAGVERYISYVAPVLAARGCQVIVAGGEPATMQALLADTGVRHIAAGNLAHAWAQVARCRGVDVVHAHMTAAEWAVVLARPVSRPAVVSTRHFAAPRGRSPLIRLASKIVPRVLDKQIAISSFVAAAIGERAATVLSGVPVAENAVRRQQVVLVLQRLEPEKRTDLALDAWARSKARRDGWRLLIVGTGSREGALREQARSLAVEGSVEFLGHRSDVDELLSEAGILLATTPREAFGFAVVEAMAFGLPVVAAGSGAHLETVGSCSTSFLFSADDPSCCAAALDALAEDEGSRAAYGQALQAHQRAHLDLDGHVDRLLEVYEAAIEHRQRTKRKP